jgi:hypothetical protein
VVVGRRLGLLRHTAGIVPSSLPASAVVAGIVRLQHQDTTVQVADILTKDLGQILHRKHRDVLFGRKQIEIILSAILKD